MALLEPVNNLGNNPLEAIQVNAANQAPVMPEDLKQFLLRKVTDKLHEVEADINEVQAMHDDENADEQLNFLEQHAEQLVELRNQIEQNRRIELQNHLQLIGGWLRNERRPQWRQYFREQYPAQAGLFAEPPRRFFQNNSNNNSNNGSTVSYSVNSNNNNNAPAAAAPAANPFSPEDMAELREAATDMLEFYNPRQRIEDIIREIDAGRLPENNDLELLVGFFREENPDLYQRLIDYLPPLPNGPDNNNAEEALAGAAANVAGAMIRARNEPFVAAFTAEERARFVEELEKMILQGERDGYDDFVREWRSAIEDIQNNRAPPSENLWEILDELRNGPLFEKLRDYLGAGENDEEGKENEDEGGWGGENDEEEMVRRMVGDEFFARVANPPGVKAEADPGEGPAPTLQVPIKTIEEAKAITDVPPAAPVTELPQYTTRIEQKLEDCFYEGYNANVAAIAKGEFLPALRQLLIDNEAIIAGGFLLNALGKYPSGTGQVDLDIYVPCRHLKGFNLIWAKIIQATRISQFQSTHYCKSFLRKNGIRSVQKLRAAKPISPECPTQEVDVMAVRNRRPVTEVVKNFDLTFCQIWYDGRSVFATHPTHIENKVGLLQKDYVRVFLAGNTFLKHRLYKYQQRGFRVLLDPNGLNSLYTGDLSIVRKEKGKRIRWNRGPRGPKYSYIGQLFKSDDYKHLDRSSDEFLMPLIKHYLLLFCLSKGFELESYMDREYTDKELNTGITTNTGTFWKHRNTYIGKALHEGEPLEDLDTRTELAPTDGYDSEDIDFTNDETIVPIVQDGAQRGVLPSVATILTQSPESIVDHILFRFVTRFTNPFPEVPSSNPLDGGNPFFILTNYLHSESNKEYQPAIGELPEKPRLDWRPSRQVDYLSGPDKTIGKIINKLVTLPYTYSGFDPITLEDDQPLYALHEHSPDEGISFMGLKEFLEGKRQQPNKDSIECYSAGCPFHITMSEVYTICKAEQQRLGVSGNDSPLAWYDEFAKYIPPSPNAALAEHIIDATQQPPRTASVTAILHDTKWSTGDIWGPQYHLTMCPFCLSYIGREEGCIYVQHDNSIGGITQVPKCLGKNLVSELFERYTQEGRRIVQADRRGLFEDHLGNNIYPGLEVCVECGRPCLGHYHFDLQPRMNIFTTIQYGKCPGGGRRELIARVLAVRQTQRENPGMDPAELHRRCALAADVAWNNQDLLAKADLLLARTNRVAANLNTALNNQPLVPPAAPGNDQESPLAFIGDVFAGGHRSGTKRRVGKPMVCQHGYGPGYKGRLDKTAKRRLGKAKKGTRKV